MGMLSGSKSAVRKCDTVRKDHTLKAALEGCGKLCPVAPLRWREAASILQESGQIVRGLKWRPVAAARLLSAWSVEHTAARTFRVDFLFVDIRSSAKSFRV